MIAALMLYSLVTGSALACGAWWLERSAAIARRPRRWIWLVALGALVVLTALASGRTFTQSGVVASAVVEPSSGHLQPATSRFGAVSSTLASARGGFDDVLAAWVPADEALAWAWLTASLALTMLYGATAMVMTRRCRQWRRVAIDAEDVLVAPSLGPAVVGVLRPRVLVPEWVLAAAVDTRRLVLVHERQHIDAGDHWLFQAAVLVVALMPWHPAAWWMAARLRVAVEIDCDARVLATVGRRAAVRRQYGDLLLAVASRRDATVPRIVPALIESSSTLARRIAAMFPNHRRPAAARAWSAAGAGLLLLLVALGVPAARLQAQVTPVAPPDALTPHRVVLVSGTLSSPQTAPSVQASPASVQPLSQPAQAPAPQTSPLPAPQPPSGGASKEASQDEEFGKGAYPYDTAGLVRPMPISSPSPLYTADAMRQKIQGRLIVEVVVGVDGLVEDARIAESLDQVYGLDANALAAIRRWTFVPATLDGSVVRSRVFVLFELRLH